MNSKTTSANRKWRAKGPTALGLVTALTLLLVGQGSMALSGGVHTAETMSPATLFSAVRRQTDAVISQAEGLASNLRLVYDIQVLLADEEVEQEATVPAAAEPAQCSLSAAGLGHAWLD